MLPRVVFLNGPPKVGKDYLGQFLTNEFGYQKLKMTRPMDLSLQALLGVSDEEYRIYREEAKDVPQEEFSGLSFRQVLIDFSEEFCKPRFGDRFFGRRGADFICSESKYRYVITDSGFPAEAREIVDRVGDTDCLLVRLYADGCDFASDSRGYLFDIGCKEIRFTNEKTDKATEDFLNLFHTLD